MQHLKRPWHLVVVLAFFALAAGDAFTPARYRSGPLPAIPVEAVGAGQVFLELTVSSTGTVSAVKPLRATPPFTGPLTDAARQWQFRPAEELVEPAPGAAAPGRAAPGPAGDTTARKRVESKVFVAGMFRSPSLNAPTLGTPPEDVAPESDETPFPIAAVMPLYPPLARDSGVVLVEVRVGRTGQVVDANAVRSTPPFDAPALDAARRWTFRPARLHGASVESFAYIVFAFRQ